MAVEASVVIEFLGADEVSEDVSGIIVVELDTEHDNNLDSDDNAKSSFGPDDEPVFLIHHDNTIDIVRVECTDGRVNQIGSNISQMRTLEALFPKVDDEISLSYFNPTDLDETWYGNIGEIHIDDQKLVAYGGDFPCYCTAEFNVVFEEQWQLTPPPLELGEDETYTIYVVVYVRERSTLGIL